MSFFPDFTQVYFFEEMVEVDPAFVHAAPAFTAAMAGLAREPEISTAAVKKASIFFMINRLLNPI